MTEIELIDSKKTVKIKEDINYGAFSRIEKLKLELTMLFTGGILEKEAEELTESDLKRFADSNEVMEKAKNQIVLEFSGVTETELNNMSVKDVRQLKQACQEAYDEFKKKLA